IMLLLLLLIGGVVAYDGSVNYWQAFAPGKLLQRLDAFTLDDGTLTTTLPPAVIAAQPKLDEDAYDDDDDAVEEHEETADNVKAHDDADADADAELDSTEALSGEDYERNYEQFVRQYFDRVEENHDDDDGDDNDEHIEEQETQLDGSIETQAEASNVQHQQKKAKQDKCRRVRRQDQLCTICREPRNNEVSETCSYSHEAQPEQYAYGSGSQYKRYREKDPLQKRHTTIVQPAADSSSLCVRRQLGKSICYECKDSGGKRMNRCYDAAISKKHSSSKPRGRQSEQEQRIYKRTISYSYAEGSSQDEQPNKPSNSTTTPDRSLVTVPASSTSTPAGRRLTKLLRRRTAIRPR
ncbi:hypothetical protein KR044_012277, partial [Drosophila immigrans]